jgi:hypothetical protein
MTAPSSISLPDVLWIAPFLQKGGKDPDQDAYADYSPRGYKAILRKHYPDHLSLWKLFTLKDFPSFTGCRQEHLKGPSWTPLLSP